MPLGPGSGGTSGTGFGHNDDDYRPPGDEGGGIGGDTTFGAGLPIYTSMREVATSMDWGAQALKVAANAMIELEGLQHVAELLNAVAAKWIVTRDKLALALVNLETRFATVLEGARDDPEEALANLITLLADIGFLVDETTPT